MYFKILINATWELTAVMLMLTVTIWTVAMIASVNLDIAVMDLNAMVKFTKNKILRTYLLRYG